MLHWLGTWPSVHKGWIGGRAVYGSSPPAAEAQQRMFWNLLEQQWERIGCCFANADHGHWLMINDGEHFG